MRVRILFLGSGAAALVLTAFGGWMLSLPRSPEFSTVAPISARERADTLAALKAPKRMRPLIAIIGINDATETTDYLVTYGILQRANIADVVTLSTESGPVALFPALTVQPTATIAEFDALHPQGADFVIVPAMSRDDDPKALQWIRTQANRGATIIGICAGAKVVAAAGLLANRRATTHWYFLTDFLKRNPSIRYVPDRRLVVDDGVATTTGITASIPMMLTLIEAIAGREKAETVANDLGVSQWDALHHSAAFKLTRPFAIKVLINSLAFWNREHLGIELYPGVDEVSLALVADAWSRTYRSEVESLAASKDPVPTLGGLKIIPDRVVAPGNKRLVLASIAGKRPADVLDDALDAISRRYDAGTSRVVATQLEYPARIGLHN